MYRVNVLVRCKEQSEEKHKFGAISYPAPPIGHTLEESTSRGGYRSVSEAALPRGRSDQPHTRVDTLEFRVSIESERRRTSGGGRKEPPPPHA